MVLHGRDTGTARLSGMGGTAGATLTELNIVAEQFILSYKEWGDSLPAGVIPTPNGEGRISVAV